MNAALASTSARHASPVTTVTDASPLVAGRPVRGSMRWCSAVPVALPGPTQPGARGDRTLREREHPGRAGVEGVVDRDDPAVGLGGCTERAEVAAEVDEHAARAAVDELTGDEVGGVALADASEVERDAGRQRDGAQTRVELDGGAAGGGRRIAGRTRALGGRRRRSHGRNRRRPPRAGRSGRSGRRCSLHARTARSTSANVSGRRCTGAPAAAFSAQSSLVGRNRLHFSSSRSIASAASAPDVGWTVEHEHGDVGAHRAERRRNGCRRSSLHPVHHSTVVTVYPASSCAWQPWTSGRTRFTCSSPTSTPTAISTPWCARRRCCASATS